MTRLFAISLCSMFLSLLVFSAQVEAGDWNNVVRDTINIFQRTQSNLQKQQQYEEQQRQQKRYEEQRRLQYEQQLRLQQQYQAQQQQQLYERQRRQQQVQQQVRQAAQREKAREIRRVQQKLSDLGYDPGPIDGDMGPMTQAAIEAFEKDSGLKVNGRIDAALLSSIEDTSQRTLNPVFATRGAPVKLSRPAPISAVQAVRDFDGVPYLDYEALLNLYMADHPDRVNNADFALAYYFLKNPRRASCKDLRYAFENEVERSQLIAKAQNYLRQALIEAGKRKRSIFRFTTLERFTKYSTEKRGFPLLAGGYERTVLNDGAKLSFGLPVSTCLNATIPRGGLPSHFGVTVFGGEVMSALPMPPDQAKTFLQDLHNRYDRSVAIESLIRIESPDSAGRANARLIGARVLDQSIRHKGAVLYVFDSELFDNAQKPNLSSINGAPLTPYLLTLHMIRDLPDTLDREMLSNLVLEEVEHAQAVFRGQSSGKDFAPPFDRSRVEGRAPEFAARELAPEFEKHLRVLAENATRQVWVQMDLPIEGYDHENKLLRFKKQWNGVNYEPELLDRYDASEKTGIPAAAKDLQLYQLAACMPSKACTSPFLSICRNRKLLVKDGLLALDRVLQLNGLHMEPTAAEQLLTEMSAGLGGSYRPLNARVALTIERVTRQAGLNQPAVVFAQVDRVEILKPGNMVVASFQSQDFAAAMDLHRPQAAKLEVGPQKTGPVLLNGETLDLLVVKHFPKHLDDIETDRMMQARWKYEQATDSPQGGRFFRGSREPDKQDRRRLAPQFRKWILARAQQLGNRFLLRTKGRLDSEGFDPSAINVQQLRSWCKNLTGYVGDMKFRELAGVKSTGHGPEYGCWWKLRFEPITSRSKRAEQYARVLPPNIVDILRLSDGFPAPSEDVLPRCNGSNCPSYGAEFDLELSHLVFNQGSKKFQNKGWVNNSAYILEAKVTQARYFELKSDKPFSMELGRLLARVEPNLQVAVGADEKTPEVGGVLEKVAGMEALSVEPYGPDVVGLRLGMSFKEAERIIRTHMQVGKVLNTDRSKQFMLEKLKPYTSGRLFVDVNEKEYIAIFDEPPAARERVVGLWRRVYLHQGKVIPAALLQQVEKKYGKAERKVGFNDGFQVSWGTGAEDIYCGAGWQESLPDQRWLTENGTPAEWRKAGAGHYLRHLPQIDFRNGIGIKRIEKLYQRCGPIIDVRLMSRAGYHLTTILVDQNRYSRVFAQSMEMVKRGQVDIPFQRNGDESMEEIEF